MQLLHALDEVFALLDLELLEHVETDALSLLRGHHVLLLHIGEGVEKDGEEQVQ